ncbi:MAG: hypothetical protein AMXMBFR7_48250 [Planctomycetota bacterium]|nr:roadblock/LC7 domain-containing protein [Planctomycetota bacterium]
MQSVLAKLNKVSGVRGCMIVNKDGIVAASDFGVDVDENSIGAVASSILAALEAAIKRIQVGRLKKFMVTGNENKLAIVDAGPALLLVLLQREANMGILNVEIQEAAAAVVEKAKM